MLLHPATLQQTRFFLIQELRQRYPESEAGSIARIILEHKGFSLFYCLSNPDQATDPAIVAQINEIVFEIHTGKPIQYILGYTHFCNLKLSVNHHVLIPRPETEELVYKVIEGCIGAPQRILDIGTGSGCIALALKQNFPDTVVIGMDISREALAVAAKNARINGLEVNWIQADMLSDVLRKEEEGFDLIVSNPPYVLESERALMNSNVLEFEPAHSIFVEDAEPLIFFERIVQLSKKLLNKGGVIWVEINERMGSETVNLFSKAGFQHVEILTDIHEKERFVRAGK